MTDFVARLAARVAEHGPLCIGIDPSAATLASCGLPDSAAGALAFGRRILEAAEYRLAIVKPQSAYFERFGSAGVRALEELAALARRHEVLVLLDAKRGDIDTTGEAYAQAYFAPDAALRVDALTLHPYLGVGALRKALVYATRQGGGAFIVVRSSNPEGEALQTARTAGGETVAEALCREITALDAELGAAAVGPIGAVIGATCHDAAGVVAALPRSYVLAPGVGAQGATLEDVRTRMPRGLGRVLPSVSRAILAAGGGASELRTTIRSLSARSKELLRAPPA